MRTIYSFFLPIFVGLLCCVSCSKDDPLIDNSSAEWNLLVACGDNLSGLSCISYPEGKTSDLMPAGLSSKQITKLAIYGNDLFALSPEQNAIFVFDANSLEFRRKIDFSGEQLEPCGIAFANSTDAYIIFRNSTKVAVYDLYADPESYSRTIETGHTPTDIIFMTNKGGSAGYVVTANTSDNCLTVINSRNYLRLRDIQTEAAPAFLAAYADKNALLAVCLGDGKIPASPLEETPAYACVYHPETGETVQSKQFGPFSDTDGGEITPTGVAINNDGLCIITSDYGLFKVNLKLTTPTLVRSVKGNYKSIAMLYGLQKPLVLREDDNLLYILNASTLKEEETISVPLNFGTFLAI